MKTLVDCDFVFDVLTRGPFPSSPCLPIDAPPFDRQQKIDARAIEDHLTNCHGCRQLAEALVPAAELFHEALSDEERATLPAFNDSEMMERLHSKIIEAVFEAEEDPIQIHRIDRLCRRWLAPAMVIVPLIAASVLMWLFADNSTFSKSPYFVASLSRNQATASLRNMDLPPNCLTPISLVAGGSGEKATNTPTSEANSPGDKNTGISRDANEVSNCLQCHKVPPDRESTGRESPIDKHHYRCCTSCHAAGKEMKPVGNHAQFAAACGSCHAEN